MRRTRVTPETVMGLIETLYEGVLRPDALNDFCARLNQATNCHMSALFLQDYRRAGGDYLASEGFDRLLTEAYNRDWASKNILMERALPAMRPGLVCVSEQHVTASEWTRADYYNGFVKPHDAFHIAGGCIAYDHGVSSMVTLGRNGNGGSYSASDLELIRYLLPHLRNVLELQRRLGFLELRSELSWQIVDHLQFAVLCISASMSICFTNGRARELLTARDGVFERNGRLVIVDRRDRERLHKLCTGCAEGAGRRGGPIRVRRASHRPALTGYICPINLASTGTRLPQRPNAIVLLADPLDEVDGLENAFQVYFGTTRAEARVAVCLVRGLSLKQVADNLRISINTVKTHLKQLMRRTGTGRQGELVACLLRQIVRLGGVEADPPPDGRTHPVRTHHVQPSA